MVSSAFRFESWPPTTSTELSEPGADRVRERDREIADVA